MSEVAVRVLAPGDAGGLADAVAAGREHEEFRASSDAEGLFITKAFEYDPSIFGGAFDGDRLIGLVSSEFKFTLVAPPFRRQGIGRRLIELAASMEYGRGRPNVVMGRLPDDEAARAFLEATGFAFHSTLWDLALPAGAAVPGPTWTRDLVARAFDRSRDIETWVDLFNAAFADHATPLQLDASFITAGMDDPTIDDADTLLIADRASGELVGFCAAAPERSDGSVKEKGEIWTIGVRPARQGQGLGRQLLRWGVERLRSLGVRDIELAVNGRNERALHLYEDEGFARTNTRERWTRAIAGAATAGTGVVG